MANDGDTIILTENVTMDINLVKLVNLDLAGFTITGNVNITSETSGILAISAGTITGNLTVNVPSATVNNSATVEGTINIEDVSGNTWNELTSGNKLVFKATDKTLNIVKGVSELTIEADATIITSSPVEAKVKNNVKVIVKASADSTEEIVIEGTDEVVKLDPKKEPENPEPSVVDKTELKATIQAVKYVGVSTDGKDVEPTQKWTTQEDKAVLENAVKIAQEVLDNTEATEEVVAEAIDNLNKAVEVYEKTQQVGTKTDEVVVDKTELETAKVEAAKYEVEIYTEESYKALEEALKLPEDTQEEVNNKVEAIKKAIVQLVDKEDDSNKPIAVNSKEEYERVLKDALENFETEVVIDIKDYDKAVYNLDSLNKIMLINPEIDYGYKGANAEIESVQGSNERIITLNLEYYQSKEEMIEQKNAVETEVSEIIGKTINSGMSDVEKEIAIHDYIVKNAEYNVEGVGNYNATDHNAYGVLVLGKGVCESYAKAFYILGQAAGLEVKYVTGKGINSSGDQENHAWNMVRLDGEWYNVDTTWDDPVVENPEHKLLEVSYKYFNVSDSIMDETHIRDEELVKYPEAKGTEYTYEKLDELGMIVEEDVDGSLYNKKITSIEDLDREIKDAIEDKQDTLCLKLYNLNMNKDELSKKVQQIIDDNSEMNTNGIKSWEVRLTGDSIKLVKYTFIYE